MKIRPWTLADTQVGWDLLESAFAHKDRAKLEEFYSWLQANVIIDVQVVRQTMDRMFQHGDKGRALRVYEAAMKNYNPIAQTTAKLTALGIVLLVLLGALGGVVYLGKLLLD